MGMGMSRGMELEFEQMEKDFDEDTAFESMRDSNTDYLRESMKELLIELKTLPYYNCSEDKLAKDLLGFLVSELKIEKELIINEVLR